MPFNRLDGRNTFYFLADDEDAFGGAIIHPNSATADDLHNFISILVIPDVAIEVMGEFPSVYNIFFVGEDGEMLIPAGQQFILPGSYRIRPAHDRVRLSVTEERALPRVPSRSITSRTGAFRDAVRERDGRCVISGRVPKGAQFGRWTGFQAAHVYPLEQGDEWVRGNWSSKITNMPERDASEKMNSVQNGMLMFGGDHTRFDNYEFGIDPRAGYKIFEFSSDDDFVGCILHPTARERTEQGSNDDGVRDALLMWHFRMCVLANMKGAGEPIWDFDFADGDDAGQLLEQDPMLHSLALYQRLAQHSLVGSE